MTQKKAYAITYIKKAFIYSMIIIMETYTQKKWEIPQYLNCGYIHIMEMYL